MPIVIVDTGQLAGKEAELLIAALKAVVPVTADYYEFGNGLEQPPTGLTRFSGEHLQQVLELFDGDGTKLSERIPEEYASYLAAVENGETPGLAQVKHWISLRLAVSGVGGLILK